MTFNYISSCCRRGIITSTRHEYPDNSRFYMSLKADICSCCGKEVEEPIAVTECCGMEKCECELEELRTELAKKAEALGMSHADVIAVSQKIDELHNEMNRSTKTG